MTSGGNRWRVKEMVCIPTCYTEKSIEVRALNVTMPFMGQLLPIADGPPDDAIWAYFLGKAEQLALELDMADEIEPF